MIMEERSSMYLIGASPAGGAALDGPGLVGRRCGSAFFRTVLTLANILLNLFSFSFGTEGPACAGELMMIGSLSIFLYAVFSLKASYATAEGLSASKIW